MRRSSSTERTSEPSCSFWLRFWRVLVVVELALHAVGRAVEEIDGRPEQVVEVGLEARVGERRDRARRRCRRRRRRWRRLRAAGADRARPGTDDSHRAGARRGRGRWEMRCAGFEVGVVAIGRHGDVPCRFGRAHRGLHGDHPPAGGPGLHRERSAAAGAQRRTAGGGYFASRCKAGPIARRSRARPGGGK